MATDTTLETIVPELLTTAEAARLCNVGERTYGAGVGAVSHRGR
jgi:hypothetical protein